MPSNKSVAGRMKKLADQFMGSKAVQQRVDSVVSVILTNIRISAEKGEYTFSIDYLRDNFDMYCRVANALRDMGFVIHDDAVVRWETSNA